MCEKKVEQTLELRLSGVGLTREECLVILSRQIHVIVSEGFLISGRTEPIVFRPSKKTHRIPPDFTLQRQLLSTRRMCRPVLLPLRTPAAQPWAQVVERNLFYKTCPIFAEIPPLEDLDQIDQGHYYLAN
jgi:hypothetical protein